MDLGKRVLDKEILDCDGLRIGRVDDLCLEIGESGSDGSMPLPVVSSIVSGPMALAPIISSPTRWLARHLYRLLGLNDPRPVEIPWTAVTSIGVVIHVDRRRDGSGVSALAEAVERRFIRRLPGS
jgi:sporulation protein YlmC with PRC-barrel domain